MNIQDWWSFTCSLESLAHCRNVASLSLYLGITLVDVPFSQGRSTRYTDRLYDFSVISPRCYKDIYVNSFFPRIARLWNCLPIKCFPLIYNLSGLKSRINRHLLIEDSF